MLLQLEEANNNDVVVAEELEGDENMMDVDDIVTE